MITTPSGPQDASVPLRPTFAETVPTFLKIGLLSFGGPAGQIALMHRVLVDEKKWLDEGRYLTALNFCMLLPGPEAMQLATYAGWRMHGVAGGLMAGLLFVLPGALVILALASLYLTYGAVPLVAAAMGGVKAAVLAIVVEALMKVSRRALHDGFDWAVAFAAFLALYAFAVPFPLIVVTAAMLGFMLGGRSASSAPHAPDVYAREAVAVSATLRTIAIWLLIWIVPLLAVALVFGRGHVLTEIGLLYSKLAVVTFGGAYAVLSYLAQTVSQTYGWLTPGEMLDALGLAETTPGPLILVTEFVAVIAGARHGGGPPILMGGLAALVALWATFAPCFLWIFAGAPYVEHIAAAPRLRRALRVVTAAVVGVIANLSLWFTLHVVFARVPVVEEGPFKIGVPELASVRPDLVLFSILAALLLFVIRAGMVPTLAISAAAGVIYAISGGPTAL